MHRPQVVDGHHLGREFRCGIEELVGAVPAGGVDHDGGHADLRVGPVAQRVDPGGVGDVDGQRGDQLGLLLGGGRRRCLVEIGGHNAVAPRGERQRYRPADPRPGAGHHREPAL